MVHGRCTSIGCFAMTNAAMEEIYFLAERALHEGQGRIEVHAFPFRMTATNMAAHANSEWHGYWQNLKQGYDVFEDTRIPPKISVCGRKYVVDSASVNRSRNRANPALRPSRATPPPEGVTLRPKLALVHIGISQIYLAIPRCTIV